MEPEEKIFHVQDRYSLRGNTWSIVTVRVRKWTYHGPRVALAIAEGYYTTSEEINKVLGGREKIPNQPDDPKNLEIICTPEDMLKLANALMETSK